MKLSDVDTLSIYNRFSQDVLCVSKSSLVERDGSIDEEVGGIGDKKKSEKKKRFTNFFFLRTSQCLILYK